MAAIHFQYKANVLMLSCLGGNYHESARKAIEEQLGHKYDFHVIYPLKSLPINKFVDPENLYNWLLRAGQTSLVNCLAFCISPYLTSCSNDRINRLIENAIYRLKPVAVISLVPIINWIAIGICGKYAIPYCLITLDSDLTQWSLGLEKTAHLKTQVRYTIGYDLPTTRGMLVTKGIDPKKICTIGFPIRKEFNEPKPLKDKLCQELLLPQQRRIVLIMAGGSGGEYAYRAAKTLVSRPLNVHFVAIAGKNEDLRERIKNLPINEMNSLTALGYAECISDYMRVAHLLITKPGTGTLSEAMVIYRKYRTPFVLLDKTDCLAWEKPNIQIVEEGGFGESFAKEEELVEKVIRRLDRENPPADLDKIPQNQFHDRIEAIFKEMTQLLPFK